MLYWIFPHWRERDVIAPVWKLLTFTTNFGLDFKHAGAFSHSWSLCVEEHFYLLLPICVIVLARPKNKKWVFPLLVALFLAGIALRLGAWLHYLRPLQGGTENKEWYITYFKRIYYPSYNRLDGLLAGVSIALIYRFRPDLWRRLIAHGNLFLLLAMAFLTGACFLCYRETSLAASVFGYPLIALGFGSLVIAALSPGSIVTKIRVPGASTLALLSFTFYLTHKEIIHLTHRRFVSLGWNCDGIPVFLTTFLISLMVRVYGITFGC